ncbi:redox-regulated ATPase YchF [bacterium]|nr:redox-regulated ATPase YchF [bacterium]
MRLILQIGIVGLPNVGKTTLFNALTRGHAKVERYPFTTIEPNIGVVKVPDERLGRLKELIEACEVTPATIKFLDIAGLVKGASKGEGLGNQFLAKIKEVEAIVHVVRCFSDPNIAHIAPDLNPIRDIEIVNLELALADLELIEKRREKIEKDPKAKEELKLLEKVQERLKQEGVPELNEKEREALKGYHLLSLKPTLYVANLGEGGEIPEELKKYRAIGIYTKLESEMQELPEEERAQFRAELEIGEIGLERLIRESYRLLGLVTFFTLERKKLRAWTLEDGRNVREAAGKIHSDMEKGFIKAEVINYSELVSVGSLLKAREKGLLRIEGRDCKVREGDIITIKFHLTR